MASKNQVNMCEGPIAKHIVSFAIPVLLTTICQAMFNTADLIVVGKFSTDGTSLAAVGATSSITTLLIGLFNGLSLGAGICVSNYFGAKDRKSLEECTHTAMSLSVVIGVFIMLLGFVASRPLLKLLNTPSEIIQKAELYLVVYFLGTPFSMVYNFCAAILRAVGDSKRCFYYIACSGVVNVVLNIVFVAVFNMDVSGVAAATAISHVLSAFLAVRYLINFDGCVRLNPKKLGFDRFQLNLIIRTGVPLGLQSSCYSISTMLVQSAVNTLGLVAVGGNTAATNLGNYIYYAMNCINSAASTFTAQNYGAKNFERIKKSALVSMSMVIGLGVLLGVIVNVFYSFFLGLYTDSAAEIAYGRYRLLYFSLPYALYGLVDLFGGMLKGMRRSFTTMIISLVGICGIRVVWIMTVFKVYGSVHALYLSYPVSWVITLGVMAAVFVYVYKKEVLYNNGMNLER